MSKKQRWLLRFAADIDLGEQTVNQAHRQMRDLRDDLRDAGFPTLDFRAMLCQVPEVQAPEDGS